MEVGDHSAGAVEFLAGRQPAEGEIALSVLNANRFQVRVGDTLRLRRGEEETSETVSGIYQDVTSGGRTAKMPGGVEEGAVGHIIYADVLDGAAPEPLSREYGARFQRASIVPMPQYVAETLSHVTEALRSAAWLSFGFGLLVAGLITVLFLGLRLSRERRRLGALAALGFSRRELGAHVRRKATVMVAAGTIVGTLLAATVGELLLSWVISATGIGLTSLRLVPQPLLVHVGCPVALLGTGYLAATVVAARLRRGEISEWLTK